MFECFVADRFEVPSGSGTMGCKIISNSSGLSKMYGLGYCLRIDLNVPSGSGTT
jgi:hypothetical protein